MFYKPLTHPIWDKVLKNIETISLGDDEKTADDYQKIA